MGRGQIPAKACSKWEGRAKPRDIPRASRAQIVAVLLSGEELIDRVADVLIHRLVCGGIERLHRSGFGFSSGSCGCGGICSGGSAAALHWLLQSAASCAVAAAAWPLQRRLPDHLPELPAAAAASAAAVASASAASAPLQRLLPVSLGLRCCSGVASAAFSGSHRCGIRITIGGDFSNPGIG